MGVCNQPKTTFWTHAFCAETSCRKCLLYYLLFRFILFQVGDFHFSLVFEAEIDHLTRCPTIPIFKNLAPCTLTKGVSGKQVLKLLHQVRASVPRCWCSQVDQWRRRRNVTSQQDARITVQKSEKFQTWSTRRWDTAESQLCEGTGRDFGDYIHCRAASIPDAERSWNQQWTIRDYDSWALHWLRFVACFTNGRCQLSTLFISLFYWKKYPRAHHVMN